MHVIRFISLGFLHVACLYFEQIRISQDVLQQSLIQLSNTHYFIQECTSSDIHVKKNLRTSTRKSRRFRVRVAQRVITSTAVLGEQWPTQRPLKDSATALGRPVLPTLSAQKTMNPLPSSIDHCLYRWVRRVSS